MTAPATHTHFGARFAAGEAELAASTPGWLAPIRSAAIHRFDQLGFPSRKNEAWKYTNTAPLAKSEFEPIAPRTSAISRDDVIRAFGEAAAERCLLFDNGHFAARESAAADAWGRGVCVRSLAEMWSEAPERVRPLLEAEPPAGCQPFATLNLAFVRDGAYVEVGADAAADAPIELLFLTTDPAEQCVTHPRSAIVLEAGARATVVIRYAPLRASIGSEPFAYWTNAVISVQVGANAQLDLVTIQDESVGAFHLTSIDVEQARDSRFRSHWISLGASLARGEIRAKLSAPGADCELNGLFMASGTQHVDNQTTIDHASPHGTSRELYKGILDGRSRGVFNGVVLVQPGAAKTNAQQSNPNLLISDRAQVNSKPTLEINTDDVKCSHGSTIGRLDEDALFYLRARGLREREARAMLTEAFAAEVADTIDDPRVRQHVRDRICEKLARDSRALEGDRA